MTLFILTLREFTAFSIVMIGAVTVLTVKMLRNFKNK